MKIVLVFAFVLILLGMSLALPGRAKKSTQKANPEIYHELRNQLFQANRKIYNLPSVKSPADPWGIVMDATFEDGGSYTVLALSDGSASIYLSSGGGSIGGVRYEEIRQAAKNMVNTAANFLPHMSKTEAYPIPPPGYVAFYVLTDAGVLTATATEEDLGEEKSSLSPLFYAGHEVITQYRLKTE